MFFFIIIYEWSTSLRVSLCSNFKVYMFQLHHILSLAQGSVVILSVTMIKTPELMVQDLSAQYI